MISGSSSAYLQPKIPDSSQASKAHTKPKANNQSVQMPSIAITRGVKIIKYACLADTCHEGFETWGDARRHMKRVCHLECKPKMSDSAEKASRFITTKPNYVDPTLESRFSGKLKTDHAPSETELVGLVMDYYSKGPDSENHRKHVMARAIRPIYGNFEFSKFGFGTFKEFSIRHDLEVYRIQDMPAQHNLNSTP